MSCFPHPCPCGRWPAPEGTGEGAGQRPHLTSPSGPRRSASRGRQKTGDAAGWACALGAPPGPGGTPAPDQEGPNPAAAAGGGPRGRRSAGSLCPEQGLEVEAGTARPSARDPGAPASHGVSSLERSRDEGRQPSSGTRGKSVPVTVPGGSFSSYSDGPGPEPATPAGRGTPPPPRPRGLFGPQAPSRPTGPTAWSSRSGPPPSRGPPPQAPLLLGGLSQHQPPPHPHTHLSPQGLPSTETPCWAVDPQTLPPRPRRQNLIRPNLPELLRGG